MTRTLAAILIGTLALSAGACASPDMMDGTDAATTVATAWCDEAATCGNPDADACATRLGPVLAADWPTDVRGDAVDGCLEAIAATAACTDNVWPLECSSLGR